MKRESVSTSWLINPLSPSQNDSLIHQYQQFKPYQSSITYASLTVRWCCLSTLWILRLRVYVLEMIFKGHLRTTYC